MSPASTPREALVARMAYRETVRREAAALSLALRRARRAAAIASWWAACCLYDAYVAVRRSHGVTL